jgi:hypothetical protein
MVLGGLTQGVALGWYVDRERFSPSPSTQTGRAVLPHPAFQFVASDELAQALDSRRSEESHQPRRLAPRSPGFQAVHCWVGVRPQARCFLAAVRTALRHYTDPCGMDGRHGPTPRPCPPSLHDHYSLLRYYEGSDPGRPFRHRSWFPDSRRLNFRAFHLQTSAGLHQPRSTPSALVALFRCGLRRIHAGSPVPPTESSSLCSPSRETALRTARSFPVALHPGLLPRRSYFQLLALQCRPGQGLSPCCPSALSGAHERRLRRQERASSAGSIPPPKNSVLRLPGGRSAPQSTAHSLVCCRPTACLISKMNRAFSALNGFGRFDPGCCPGLV